MSYTVSLRYGVLIQHLKHHSQNTLLNVPQVAMLSQDQSRSLLEHFCLLPTGIYHQTKTILLTEQATYKSDWLMKQSLHIDCLFFFPLQCL